MSRRLFGYLIAAGLTAKALGAQEIAQLGRRVDSLRREAAAAQAAVLAYRKAHPPTYKFSDSSVIAGGRVKIYYDSEFADLARAAAAGADRQFAALGTAITRAGNYIFSIARDSAFNSYDTQYDRTAGLSVRQHSPGDPQNPNRTSTDADAKSVAAVIVNAISRNVGHNAAAPIGTWVSSEIPLAPESNPKNDWGALRLNIVSSPSHTGRSCFLGDIRACRVYLGLDTVPDPIHALFDTTGRRLLVKYEADRALRGSRIGAERCLSGNDDACVAVLDIINVGPLSSPFVRMSVVTHALTLGGPRSAERLIMTPGSTGDALAAAAGQPLDSLIADWQRHLSERSGTASNLPLTIAISSLVWIAICVFLALRSARWR